MSDEWNFHDVFEGGISDNAGLLALSSILSAQRQRQQQLQVLEATLQNQAKIIKTQANLLEVEKERLELEKLKQKADKAEKEAVRLLRVVMVGVGAEFDTFVKRSDLTGSPAAIRRDDRMALHLAKLALVRSRSDSLSALGDIKELHRLENIAQDLVEQHFSGCNPLLARRQKWKALENWLKRVDELEDAVKQQCAMVPAKSAKQLPSPAALRHLQTNLESYCYNLKSKLEDHMLCLPTDVAVANLLLPEFAELGQLEGIREGRQVSQSSDFSDRWRKVAAVEHPAESGKQVKVEQVPKLIRDCESARARLVAWFTKLSVHEEALKRLDGSLNRGDLTTAKTAANEVCEVRFRGVMYASLLRLKTTQEALRKLESARRGAAVEQAGALLERFPKAAPQSELVRELALHYERGAREKRTARTLVVIAFTFMFVVLASLFIDYKQGVQRLEEESNAKANVVKRESERIAAEASAKAYVAKRESERVAAEASAKVYVAKLKSDRVAAEANAKADAVQVERERWVSDLRARFPLTLNSGAIGSTIEVPLSTSIQTQFCYVPPGTYFMGSPTGEEGRYSTERQSVVTLSRSFWLAKTELTQAEWETVMNYNPSSHKGTKLPVEMVSWEDANQFISTLNTYKLLPDGWSFALPTDAQWEYACRAGSAGPFSNGELDDVGWFNGNSGIKAHEVGTKKGNFWGLYDMHGNVGEWCGDWYYHDLDDAIDPAGPSSTGYRVFRGGSYDDSASKCRSAFRGYFEPEVATRYMGLRPAIVQSKQEVDQR